MRIERVDVVRIEHSLWGSFWKTQADAPSSSPMVRFPEHQSLGSWWCPQAMVIVRVTSDGVGGIGWAEDPVGAASAAIERHFSHLLVGQDPSQIGRIWETMYRSSIPYGRKGTMLHAISAIDIALWDLAGRIAGKPVATLLGGDTNRTLTVYASNLQPFALDLFVEEIRGYLDDGFNAMKMRMPGHPGLGPRGIALNEERFSAARDTVGSSVDIMCDAYMGWDLRFSMRMADAAADYGLAWIEEPLLTDEVDAYTRLCAYSRVPISQGENECTRYGFAELIRNRAAHILQPDVHRVGGLTEIVRIANLASASGLEIIPHAFSAPTVHAMAAIPNCRMLELLTVPAWARETAEEHKPVIMDEPQVSNGVVRVPDRPGLGISLNVDDYPGLNGW